MRAVWRRKKPTGSVSAAGDAGGGETRQHPAKRRSRAERIGEHAAFDAAHDRALHCGDDSRRPGVVSEDVEHQVNMRACGVDVGDQPGEDRFVIGQHFDRVAAEDRQVAECLRQADRGCERRVGLRMVDRGTARQPLQRRIGMREEFLRTLDTDLRQPRPADRQIQQQAEDGLEKNQQQPALRRVGRAAERDDDEHRQSHHPLAGNERGEPELAVEQQVGRHRVSWDAAPTRHVD